MKDSAAPCLKIGEEKSAGGVVALADELATEQLVAPRVGGVLKLGEDLEVRLVGADGFLRGGAILEQEKIPESRGKSWAKRAFPIRRPEVEGRAHRFFRAVVEVISE